MILKSQRLKCCRTSRHEYRYLTKYAPGKKLIEMLELPTIVSSSPRGGMLCSKRGLCIQYPTIGAAATKPKWLQTAPFIISRFPHPLCLKTTAPALGVCKLQKLRKFNRGSPVLSSQKTQTEQLCLVFCPVFRE